MCGGVYVSQLRPFTAGLAGSMQEYEVWLGVWRGRQHFKPAADTSETGSRPGNNRLTWTGRVAPILKLGMAGRL